MPYTVEFAPSAARELQKLERRVQTRLATAIDALALNFRPQGAAKLTGTEAWRIRVDDYRVLYEIKDRTLVVLILRIAHRREVYR